MKTSVAEHLESYTDQHLEELFYECIKLDNTGILSEESEIRKITIHLLQEDTTIKMLLISFGIYKEIASRSILKKKNSNKSYF